MITTLRKKFIIIAMSSTFIVLALIMGVVNFQNYNRMIDRADRLTLALAENGGRFAGRMDTGRGRERGRSRDFTEETPFQTRFFTVTLNQDGMVADTDIGNIAAISESEAIEFAQAIFEKGKTVGFQDIYRYRNADMNDGQMIVFVDCTQDMNSFRNLFITSISVSLGGLLAVFILVLFFSKIVFQPVEESFEKQKRFITDASHEIKTPLTIIDANTEVLEMTYGESQWIKSTRNQIQRLTELTQNLVALSRLDEKGTSIDRVDFSLSEAVEESIQPFMAVAESSGKKLDINIEEKMHMSGDEQSIRELVGILMDNALKYSLKGTIIRVSLNKTGRKTRLTISNLADGLSEGNMNQLFERFYRLDSSRNSATGGSGIGLSIAQMIVQSHKGRITADSPDGKKLVITAEFRN